MFISKKIAMLFGFSAISCMSNPQQTLSFNVAFTEAPTVCHISVPQINLGEISPDVYASLPDAGMTQPGFGGPSVHPGYKRVLEAVMTVACDGPTYFNVSSTQSQMIDALGSGGFTALLSSNVKTSSGAFFHSNSPIETVNRVYKRSLPGEAIMIPLRVNLKIDSWGSLPETIDLSQELVITFDYET